MHRTATDETPGFRLGDGDPRFSARTASATSVELVVERPGAAPLRFPLQQVADTDRWVATTPGVVPGDRYHLLVDGPDGPRHDFDATRALLDPYARGIVATGADAGASVSDGVPAPVGPRWTAEVVDDAFDWGGVGKPVVPLDRAVVYEANVRTLTQTNPDVPEHLRGTYAGVAHPSTIAHLHRIGVTTLELLPVHAFDTEAWLREAGRENAWGYNSLGFFAPHAGYASADARSAGASGVLREFKGMVRLLHEAGIQVVLDVVYNHTAEEGSAARRRRCVASTARTTTGGRPTARRTTTPPGAGTRSTPRSRRPPT